MEIQTDLSNDVDNSFLNIVDFEFSAIISNIINNSIDALSNIQKVVSIRTRKIGNQIVINISDTGRGIPANIVGKIFLRSFSYEKSEGTGYGLYHAKTFIESWGGRIGLTQTSSNGTEFELILPIWEPPQIKIRDKNIIIILDDDKKIHEKWNQKLNEFLVRNEINVDIQYFEKIQGFFNWFNNAEIDFSNIIFLIDQYIEEENDMNGTNIIESLGIADVSWLVTNSFDEHSLIDICNKQSIKVLPKPCVDYVKLLSV